MLKNSQRFLAGLFLAVSSLLLASSVATAEYRVRTPLGPVTTVAVPVTITLAGGTLPDGAVGQPYAASLAELATIAGTGAPSIEGLTWDAPDGLPVGISLNAGTGGLSGTPVLAGAASFTISAHYGAVSGSALYTLSVNAGLPQPPSSLSAVGGVGQVALTWGAPSDDGGSAITGYKVYGGTNSGPTVLVHTSSGTGTSWTNSGLANGTTYFYRVQAVTAAGDSDYSTQASATTSVVASSAPTGLAATAAPQQVALTWTAPSNTGGGAITGYQVYRGTSSNPTTLVQTLAGSTLTWTSTGLADNTLYYFRVVATNSAGNSPYSTQVSATTPVVTPGTPTGLSAVGGSGQVSLSWTAPASTGGSTITGYQIYRDSWAGPTSLLTTVGGGTTSFTDTAVAGNTAYYYRVKAVNSAGAGDYSTQASATTSLTAGTVMGGGYYLQTRSINGTPRKIVLANHNAAATDWNTANTNCNSLVSGGFSDWHAILAASDYVVISQNLSKLPSIFQNAPYWTWEVVSTGVYRTGNPATGVSGSAASSTSLRYLCIRYG